MFGVGTVPVALLEALLVTSYHQSESHSHPNCKAIWEAESFNWDYPQSAQDFVREAEGESGYGLMVTSAVCTEILLPQAGYSSEIFPFNL